MSKKLNKIKAASSDERPLAVCARQAAAPLDCMLTCYLHVMLGRKQAVNVMSKQQNKIKAASSDERPLAVRARQAAAPLDCMLICYLHVMLGRKQAVNVISIGWCLPDFLCPVGGAMDITQFWCTDIFRVTPSTFLNNLVKMGNCMLNL